MVQIRTGQILDASEAWSTWNPTITGFSSNPASGLYYFKQIGKTVVCMIAQPNNGTSNATTFSISLPVTARTLTNATWTGSGAGVDNGVGVSNPVLITITSGATVMNLFTNWAGAAWTGSGSKRIAHGIIIYEAA